MAIQHGQQLRKTQTRLSANKTKAMGMKNHTAATALMLLVGITSTSASPQSVKHAPDFSLMISTQNQTIPKDKINLGVAIEVVERNTSHHDVNVSTTVVTK